MSEILGIIGGTGLYQIDGLTVSENRKVETPFGQPSAPVMLGTLQGKKVAFLPRHGTHHSILPSEINFRANIWALKSVGVRRVVSVSATGSLVKEIAPGDLALPNQYLDFTKGKRAATFFGNGIVAHISSAEPACHALSSQIRALASSCEIPMHADRAYACVEGPRLGTRVESFLLKSAGCHLVGMTNVPEVFLAREAQLCYSTIAVATDYDCWLDDPSQHATVDKVIALYKQNLQKVQRIILALVESDQPFSPCGCSKSLEYAVLTPESAISEEGRKVLAFLKT